MSGIETWLKGIKGFSDDTCPLLTLEVSTGGGRRGSQCMNIEILSSNSARSAKL